MSTFRICSACREPIRPGARVCPRCRTTQGAGRMSRLGTTLKWIGGGTTVISLVIGVATLNGLFRGWSERRDAVGEMVEAAHELDGIGEYRQAWTMYEDALALDPGSPRARHGQRDLAMHWLRNIRIVGDETFTEIADLTTPVLYRGLPSARPERAADLLAHVAWAYFLKGREMRISIEVDSLYARAVGLDPENPFANAMWGHWLLSKHEDVHAARPRFETAFASEREHEWIRGLQMSALKWPIEGRRLFSDDTFRQEKLVAIAVELLRVTNDMRERGEPRPDADVRRVILRSYGQGYKGEYVDLLLPELPAESQLATVRWLAADDTHTDGTAGMAQQRYVVARLTEAAGDTGGALALYHELADEDLFYDDLEKRVDEALERLTGSPSERTLQRGARRFASDEMPAGADPWSFHEETLRNFEPVYTTPNFVDATEFLLREVADGPERHRIDEALGLLEDSREHVRAWIAGREDERQELGGSYWGMYTAGTARNAQYIHHLLWSYTGQFALEAGRADRAVAELEDLNARLAALDDEQSLRYDVQKELAYAYSQRSAGYEEGDARRTNDVHAALRHLRESVEGKNRIGDHVDWNEIKDEPYLNPIRAHEDYRELVRGR